MTDLTKTLRELEGGPPNWPGSETWPSYLVATCERLYKKPIKDFTTEDLRVMIGQQIGVEFLVPVALERLVENPFEQGDFHPGDLLGAVLRLPREYWHTHFGEWQVAISIAKSAVLAIDAVMPDIKAFQALPRPV